MLIDPTSLAFLLALVALLTWLSIIDHSSFRIPNSINLTILLLGIGWTAIADPSSMLVKAIAAFTIGASLTAISVLYQKMRRQIGLGLGDVKLMAALAFWVSWPLIPWAVAASCFAALTSIAMVHGGQFIAQRKLAFGPYIAIGFLPFVAFEMIVRTNP